MRTPSLTLPHTRLWRSALSSSASCASLSACSACSGGWTGVTAAAPATPLAPPPRSSSPSPPPATRSPPAARTRARPHCPQRCPGGGRPALSPAAVSPAGGRPKGGRAWGLPPSRRCMAGGIAGRRRMMTGSGTDWGAPVVVLSCGVVLLLG